MQQLRNTPSRCLGSIPFCVWIMAKKTGCLGASGCPVLIGGSRFIMCLLVGRIVTTTWADLRPVSCLMCSSFPGGRCPVAHLHVRTWYRVNEQAIAAFRWHKAGRHLYYNKNMYTTTRFQLNTPHFSDKSQDMQDANLAIVFCRVLNPPRKQPSIV